MHEHVQIVNAKKSLMRKLLFASCISSESLRTSPKGSLPMPPSRERAKHSARRSTCPAEYNQNWFNLGVVEACCIKDAWTRRDTLRDRVVGIETSLPQNWIPRYNV